MQPSELTRFEHSRAMVQDFDQRLKKLDEVAEQGIDDPVRLYEDTAKVAREAIEALILTNPPPTYRQLNPDYRDDHDSLVARFDQLQDILVSACEKKNPSTVVVQAAALVLLLRGQVLK